MLALQFSLRRLLAVVTGSALLCLIVGAAANGQIWALAVCLAFVALPITILVHGLLLIIVRRACLLVERFVRLRRPERGRGV